MKIIFLRSIEISTKVWVEFKLEASATTSPRELMRVLHFSYKLLPGLWFTAEGALNSESSIPLFYKLEVCSILNPSSIV